MVEGKRILITGGGGFIGTTLARRLALHNDVTCFDLSFGDTVAGTKIVIGSILDGLDALVSDKHIVIHTAARLGVRAVLNDVIATLETNYTGTANLLRAVQDSSWCEQLVVLSTSEVFGEGAGAVSENGASVFPSSQDKRWCYGVGKLAAEHLAFGYYRQHELPVTVIRPFNIFGEGRTGDYALTHFILSALRGKDLTLNGHGTQIRAWCHIDDFCDAVLSTLGNKEAIGRVFNIGNPVNTITVYELAKLVVRLCLSSSKIVPKRSHFTDINFRVPDITLASRVLGFHPRIGLEEGLVRTIGWMKENVERINN